MKQLLACALAVILTTRFAVAAPTTQPTLVEVTVDPRVELMSVIFYLAGNPEYSQPRIKSYASDASQYFQAFSDHAAIQLARQLRSKSGISYDAPMALAVHVSDLTMGGVVPLDPRPEGLDARWKPRELRAFIDATRSFVSDAGFMKFFDAHRPMYAIATQRMRETLAKNAKLSWFDEFFGKRAGERATAKFHLILAPMNGGQCYGPHLHFDDHDELYCILGIWNTDEKGEPTFPKDVLPFVVHEFCHSYANPLIDAHYPELKDAGEKLFAENSAIMKKQAYATPQIMLRESLVRACVVCYRNQVEGAGAARAEIAQQEKLGFAWMNGLSELLAEYESHRDQYKTLDDFMPKIVAFFDASAKS